MISTREAEIISSMKTFTKDTYYKSEIITELFALQQEVVDMTFSGENSELSNLRIWDVLKHLEQMNEEAGGGATESLKKFRIDCRDFSNAVRAEISGNRGESKAFDSLRRLRTPSVILRNVELKSDECRTEIDAIVINNKGVFILEVKNTAKNIFIDECGNYYRMGEYQKLDCNIAVKLEIKERLLREALFTAGLDAIRITKLVVFTDNRIEVRNRNSTVASCFVGQLPYLIDEQDSSTAYSGETQKKIVDAVEQAKCHESYPIKLNITQFKANFAEVVAQIELATHMKANEQQSDEKVELAETASPEKRRVRILESIKRFLYSDFVKKAGTAAASIAIVGFSTFALMKSR